MGLGLVGVLVVLTTWVVAWVSIWWVPPYLSLMVLIFVVPQGHGSPKRVSELDGKFTDVNLTDLNYGLRVNCAAEGDHRGTAELARGTSVDVSSTTSSDFSPDLADSTYRQASTGSRPGTQDSQSRRRTRDRLCSCHLDPRRTGSVCPGRR